MKNAETAKASFGKAAQLAEAQSIFEARWDRCLGLGKTYRNLGLTSGRNAAQKRGFTCRKERIHIYHGIRSKNIQFRTFCGKNVI